MRKVLVTGFAVAVLTVAGCGSGSSGSNGPSTAPSTAGGMTAAQVLAKAGKAMDGVKSAQFAATVTLGVAGNPGGSSTTAPASATAIVLHVVGTAGTVKAAPAANVTVSLTAGAKRMSFGIRATGHHAWLGHKGKWYVVPAGKAKAAGSGASASLGSSASIAGLGIHPQAWAKSSTVTSEQLEGAKVYQVVTTADTARIMSDLVKLLTSSAVAKAAAQNSSAGAELNLLKQDPALLKSLQKAFVSASAQEWIDASTFRLSQGGIDARFSFTSGGVTEGLTLHVLYRLSGFGQPVRVVAPKHALPFKQLSKGLSALGAAGAVGL